MVLLLIAVLMMSMDVTAFADPDDPAGGGDDPAAGGGSGGTNTVTVTITPPADVEGTVGGETYALYRIFDVTKISTVTEPVTDDEAIAAQSESGYTAPSGFAYTISTDSGWFSVLGSVNAETGAWSPAANQKWVTLTAIAGDPGTYNVAWATDTDATETEAKAFAAWLLAKKGSIAADKTITGTATGAVATDIDDGYYLITSTLGTNLVLATTNINITTKNQYPGSGKTASQTSYSIGDYVKYTITVVLPASVDYSKTVTVHDTMDDVLTLCTDSTGDHAWKASAGDTDFTEHVTLTTGKADKHDGSSHAVGADQVGYDFVLDITSLAPLGSADPEEKTVTITYYAELTSGAVIGTLFVNNEFVEYSQYTTPEKEADAVTYGYNLEKQDGEEEPLTGAEFEMYDVDPTDAANSTTVYYTDADHTAVSNTETEFSETVTPSPIEFVAVTGGYKKADSNDTGKVTTIEAGSVSIGGFGAGTYYLLETKAPSGYNKLAEPFVITFTDKTKDADAAITITGNGLNITDTNVINYVLKVVNQTGTVLPSTGGVGTALFYVGGGLLIAIAAAILITKKRRSDR